MNIWGNPLSIICREFPRNTDALYDEKMPRGGKSTQRDGSPDCCVLLRFYFHVIRIVRAFLLEEQKIVKKVVKQHKQQKLTGQPKK